jgi:hypothetical protein
VIGFYCKKKYFTFLTRLWGIIVFRENVMTLCLHRDIKSGLRSELSRSLYLSKCSAVPVVGPDLDEDERSLVLLTKPPFGFTVCISI